MFSLLWDLRSLSQQGRTISPVDSKVSLITSLLIHSKLYSVAFLVTYFRFLLVVSRPSDNCLNKVTFQLLVKESFTKMQCVNSCIYSPCAVQPFLAPRFTDKMIHFFCFIPHAGDQMNFNILKLYISALILDSLEVLDNQKTRCSNIQMIKLDLLAQQKIFVFGKGSKCV